LPASKLLLTYVLQKIKRYAQRENYEEQSFHEMISEEISIDLDECDEID